MGELTIYEGQMAVAKTSGTGYKVTSPLTGGTVKLERGVDFGVVPGTKSPSLYKSGAEKICMAYGLMQRYTVESSIETLEPEPFFYYRIRCDLVKVANNGVEYVFCSGEGSANTREKRNGRNGAFDAANSTLKMAQKRALTHVALAVSGLSSMFTQDMENDDFMQSYNELAESMKSGLITKPQGRRLFAIGASVGLNAKQVKDFLKSKGIENPTEILQEQYEALVDELQKLGEVDGGNQ